MGTLSCLGRTACFFAPKPKIQGNDQLQAHEKLSLKLIMKLRDPLVNLLHWIWTSLVSSVTMNFKCSFKFNFNFKSGFNFALVIVSLLVLPSCQSQRPPSVSKPLAGPAGLGELSELKGATAISTQLHLEGRLLIEITHQALEAPNAFKSSSEAKSLISSNTKRINAPFELELQNGVFGELRLLGPLGTTSALINWSPEHAQLQSSELKPATQLYKNLSLLVNHWLGADLPLENMFDWLNGHEVKIDGWEFSSVSPTIKTIQGKGKDTGPNAPWVSLKMILNEPAP